MNQTRPTCQYVHKRMIVYGALLVLLLFMALVPVTGQPFVNDIAVFKKKDTAAFPPKKAILFIGSSSFTLWKDIQDYFPQHTILNRGFGGSSLTDLLRYKQDIIFPYEPRQIVIYCGENDLAGSDTVTASMVLERFRQLFTDIRNYSPAMPVAYVAMKPSPSRAHLKTKVEQANTLIQSFLNQQKNTVFIDVYQAMLNEHGLPMADIFLADNLHMNKKGYAIWQKLIAPHLLNQ